MANETLDIHKILAIELHKEAVYRGHVRMVLHMIYDPPHTASPLNNPQNNHVGWTVHGHCGGDKTSDCEVNYTITMRREGIAVWLSFNDFKDFEYYDPNLCENIWRYIENHIPIGRIFEKLGPN